MSSSESDLVEEQAFAEFLPRVAGAVDEAVGDRDFVLLAFRPQDEPYEQMLHWIHSPKYTAEKIAELLEEAARKIREAAR